MNTLTSIAVCAALMIAYYMVAGRAPIPPDTHVTFVKPGNRLDLLADGTVVVETKSGAVRRRIGKAAIRKVLRVFARTHFMDADVTRYHGSCTLTLVRDHRKTSVQDDCAAIERDFALPLAALSEAVRRP